MAEYDLPAGPAELFEAVRGTLGDYLGGQHHMRLGGGTALAARWAHRHSTDVDLFIGSAPYERLFTERLSFRDHVQRHLGAHAVDVDSGIATIHFRQNDQLGEVTLATSPPLTRLPASSDTVRNTPVHLEATAEILAKKLHYRMFLQGRLLPRDLYDLAMAREHEPGLLHSALRAVDTPDLRAIQMQLHSLPDRWLANHGRPLIRPVSRHAASNAVRITDEIITDAIRSRGPSRSFRTDTSRGR